MARKLDLSGVKTFLIAKGEKLAVAICVAAAAILAGYGVMNGMNAKYAPNSKVLYPDALKKNIDLALAKINAGEPEKVGSYVPQRIPPWLNYVSDFRQGKLFPSHDISNNKRQNPRALALRADPEKNQIRMDYVRGAIFAYDVNSQQKTATAVKGAPAGALQGPAGKMVGQFPLVTVQPRRMVVVQAVFPLTEQIEEFRKAFRMLHAAELFQSKDLPRFLGLNVMKTEVVPGQGPEWRVLVGYDERTGKDVVDPALLAMLREAIFDDELSKTKAPYAFQGLVMPLPKQASLPLFKSYPKPELDGIAEVLDFIGGGGQLPGGPGGGAGGIGVREIGGGGAIGDPGFGGQGAGDAELDTIKWTKLAPSVRDKLSDDFYPFDPMGFFPDPNEGLPLAGKEGFAPVQPTPNDETAGEFHQRSEFSAAVQWNRYPAPKMPAHLMPEKKAGDPMSVLNPNQAGLNVKPYEALVRFVDVDVKPGKTYKYTIQVRIANPNYKKPGEVAFAALADSKELPPAPPVETPTISIPTEYFLYAVDQKPWNPKVPNGSEDKDVKPSLTGTNPTQTQVPIQIHSWVERTVDRDTDTQFVIADWAIAERLLLRRGDQIGRTTNIEIPVWNKKTGKYEMAGPAMAGGGDGARPPQKKFGGGMMFPPKNFDKGPAPKKEFAVESGSVGIPVDFAETTPPAVLVDFEGGRKGYQIPTGSGVTRVPDESALQLLILGADGKLIVRNSRTDSDPDDKDNKERNKERQDRVEDWKKKTTPFRRDGLGAAPGAGVPDTNPFLQPRKGN